MLQSLIAVSNVIKIGHNASWCSHNMCDRAWLMEHYIIFSMILLMVTLTFSCEVDFLQSVLTSTDTLVFSPFLSLAPSLQLSNPNSLSTDSPTLPWAPICSWWWICWTTSSRCRGWRIVSLSSSLWDQCPSRHCGRDRWASRRFSKTHAYRCRLDSTSLYPLVLFH